MCEGIAVELCGIQLGDERLKQRSYQILAALAANPEASINASCEGWSESIAADRFFNHASVTPEQILQPHREATQRRLREQPVVLIVQDTTELDISPNIRPRTRGASIRRIASGCMSMCSWRSRPTNSV